MSTKLLLSVFDEGKVKMNSIAKVEELVFILLPL